MFAQSAQGMNGLLQLKFSILWNPNLTCICVATVVEICQGKSKIPQNALCRVGIQRDGVKRGKKTGKLSLNPYLLLNVIIIFEHSRAEPVFRRCHEVYLDESNYGCDNDSIYDMNDD